MTNLNENTLAEQPVLDWLKKHFDSVLDKFTEREL